MSNIISVDFQTGRVGSIQPVERAAAIPAPDAVTNMLDFGRHFVAAHNEVRALHTECHRLIVSTNNLGESARKMSRAVAHLQGALDNFREQAIGDVARQAILEAFA